MNQQLILSTAYLPPIEYFAFLMRKQVCLEYQENYQKQSYRNRCCIMTGNGVHSLVIPVIHKSCNIPVSEVRIDYSTPWPRMHWRTIVSAYGNSPFFLYYRDFLQPFFEKQYELLFDFNFQIMQTLLKFLRVSTDITLTKDFVIEQNTDLRQLIHPKHRLSQNYPFKNDIPYNQVFEDKFGYVRNLSVLDLLCNLGNEASAYIQNNCTFALTL